MLQTLGVVVYRDLLLAFRRRSDLANTVLFFVLVVSMFPFGVGPEPNLLRAVAPGVLWVAALLASMLALSRMFAGDHADGTLEQMVMSSIPLSVVVFGKVTAHWLVTGVPLVILAPVLALQFDVPTSAYGTLMLSLVLGTPVLSLIGGIGAALTLGVRGSGVLTALLVLPLYVPVLILGAGAVDGAAAGLDVTAHLLLMGALLVFAMVFSLWPVAAALRVALE
ncbi:MAG TPA: heme exporter protein CcmB [Burkholderiales bacterium]|nr:heme exporter protein CcmB [Burkholderiales bacterium]